MSYIDETYGKQLEEALRGLVSRPALGQPWFGFHVSEVPAGVLLFTATTHSRVLYADFWKYIQDKNLVKTEEEWQSIYTEQGWCPFYSDGDGIDTFRMPSAPLYLHGAGTLSEAGQYIEAGLPNINGTLSGYDLTGPEIGTSTGALYVDSSITTVCGANVASDHTSQLVGFDASLSNPIYGNSSTVTPETSKMLFGIWAISAPQQPIPDATVEGIISELGVVSNNALEAKNGLNGVVRSVNGVSADADGNVKLASWQMNNVLLSNSATLGNHAIDVSEHIPSDGEYEALLYCACSTNNKTDSTNVEIGHKANGESDLINMTIGSYDIYTRIQTQTTILPVPQNRIFHLYISGAVPNKVHFYLLGYRRIA